MDQVSSEDFGLLLQRAGLNLTQDERDRLRPLYERFLERLKVLHSADHGEGEVAGSYDPRWS